MKHASYFITVGLIISLSIMGCGSDSASNAPAPPVVGQDIIQKYNFHIEGEHTTISVTLPQQFTDANWGLKESLCERAGYSLTPYAGQTVSLIAYNITEKYASEPLYLWVVAQEQTSICGYLSVRENSNLTPGGFAVNDPNIQ